MTDPRTVPDEAKRVRTLYGILRKLPSAHRYTVVRWIVAIVATLGITALSVFDVLRFDLWGGHHHWLGEEVDFVTAARAFGFPFLAVNIAIVLVSRFFGRYLCGFVCPVGSLGRLGEWARFSGKKLHSHLVAPLLVGLSSFAMTAVTFSFWVDWHVFIDGSAVAKGVSFALLAVGTIGLYLLIQRVGLKFCRSWCPSGVYFAVLGQDSSCGVQFANPDSCTDCGICDTVCPMHLEPRKLLDGAARGADGLYGEHMSNLALCIRCGDCIVGCEEVGSRRSADTALRLGWVGPHKGATAHATVDAEPSGSEVNALRESERAAS